MFFELHCHSRHSKGGKIKEEGISSPADIIRAAKHRGLGGIALTDHNTVDGWKEAEREAKRQGLLFIPGEEIETESGHVLGLGLTEVIAPGLGLEETLDKIREQGGLSVAAHPFDPRGLGTGHEMIKADAVEVFNSMAVDRLANWAAKRIARKAKKPMVCGSDAHMASLVGLSRNSADARTLDGVLKSVREGKVKTEGHYMSVGQIMEWNRKRVIRSRDSIARYIRGEYSQPKKAVAGFLLRRFVNHPKSPVWLAMARMGPPVAFLWSGFNLLMHY